MEVGALLDADTQRRGVGDGPGNAPCGEVKGGVLAGGRPRAWQRRVEPHRNRGGGGGGPVSGPCLEGRGCMDRPRKG
jgi:hypothetical protein